MEPPDTPGDSPARCISTLLTNAVIFHTTLDLMTAIRDLVAEGWEITLEDLAVLWSSIGERRLPPGPSVEVRALRTASRSCARRLRYSARMTVQIALRLEPGLAESARAAAADTGTNLSEWIRRVIRREAAAATALRARAEEDTHPPLYTAEKEDALMASRRARAIAAFEGRE